MPKGIGYPGIAGSDVRTVEQKLSEHRGPRRPMPKRARDNATLAPGSEQRVNVIPRVRRPGMVIRQHGMQRIF